jgi:putative peptidoglycan lipid II flippase
MRRLGLRLRPTLRFPSGLAVQVGGLALVGVLEFLANDLAAVVIIILANGHGTTGALVIFNYASLVFNAVAAVLTLSITTSAFPVLSARDGDEFDRTCAGSTRAVLLMSWLGTAVTFAVAVPAARVLVHSGQQAELIEGFAAFAPGIAGTAVITNLSRVMFALRKLGVASLALTGNWVLVIAFDAILTQFAPPRLEVAALALGNTLGQTMVAIPLIIVTRRIRGRAALDGVRHVVLTGLLACVAGGVVGVVVTNVLVPTAASGKALDAAAAVVAATCSLLAFGIVAFVLDRGDLRTIARQVAIRLARLGSNGRHAARPLRYVITACPMPQLPHQSGDGVGKRLGRARRVIAPGVTRDGSVTVLACGAHVDYGQYSATWASCAGCEATTGHDGDFLVFA